MFSAETTPATAIELQTNAMTGVRGHRPAYPTGQSTVTSVVPDILMTFAAKCTYVTPDGFLTVRNL
ncbi:hypothetical protein [Streptomyces sp. NPDC018711]|uniref:hypothetical protein n=1 Tax=Streptomyces sp. NPDC018711 TaxID=3365052 RepID=UPI0037B5B0B8